MNNHALFNVIENVKGVVMKMESFDDDTYTNGDEIHATSQPFEFSLLPDPGKMWEEGVAFPESCR